MTPSPRRVRRRRRTQRATLTQRDKLLRNSAIACALLLGILALGNLRQPWAQKAAEGIERAMTMHINPDDSKGNRLSSITDDRRLVKVAPTRGMWARVGEAGKF